MKVCLTVIFINFVTIGYAQKNCTRFPTDTIQDYLVKYYEAKVAMPTSDDGRIWIKGSMLFPWYTITNNLGFKKGPFQLTAPNYTTIELVPLANTTILFGKTAGDVNSLNKVILQPVGKRKLEEGESPFSIIFYGCLEPFEINKKSGKASINIGKWKGNYTMRKLVRAVAYDQSMKVLKQIRMEGYTYTQAVDTVVQKLMSPPKLVIGTGDQVYVDAGYDNQKGEKSDISTWEIKEKPNPTVPIDCYIDHINRMYLHFGSFQLINDMFHLLPSTAIWDDHEIRDGWGSQGDEYVNGRMNPKFKDYYFATRVGYINHYWSMCNYNDFNVDQLKSINSELHQEFIVGGKRVFAFDLRSNRDINQKQVVDPVQMEAFKKWINQSKENEEIVILSSIPLFLGYRPKRIKLIKRVKPELRDDINDGWDSDANKNQRNNIIQLILDNRIHKNVKPYIVSGDVHTGGILEVWYGETKNTYLPNADEARRKRRVLCYELISTGINHETLNKEKSNFLTNFFNKERKATQKQWINENLVDSISVKDTFYTVSNIARISQISLNFGAIDFDLKKTKLHVFLHSIKHNFIEQFTVETQWNKNDFDDRKFMKIKINNGRRFKYLAAMPQERKTIYPQLINIEKQ